jgi:hypothetical protein
MNRYTRVFFLLGAATPWLAGTMVATGSGGEEAGLDGVAKKVVELLLLRLALAESREVAWNAGKQRRSGARGSSGEVDPGKDRGREIVWEVAGVGSSSTVCSEADFIGRRGRARRHPEVGVRRCA